jgi:hypothetical protein
VAVFEKRAVLEQQFKLNKMGTECSGLEFSRAARPGKADEQTYERPLLNYLPILETPRSHSEALRDKQGVIE